MAESSSSTTRRRRKDARPGEIIAAALEVFTARGFAATRLDEIAARAGVSKGTLYLYFPNKEELFKAMVRQTVLPNVGAFEALVDAHRGSAADLLAELLARAAQVFGASKVGRIPKIVVAEAGTFPDLARFWVEEVVERGLALMRRVLARGIEAGEFTPVQTDGVMVLFAPMLLLAMWNSALGPAVGRLLDPALIAGEASRLLLDGLKVRKEEP